MGVIEQAAEKLEINMINHIRYDVLCLAVYFETVDNTVNVDCFVCHIEEVFYDSIVFCKKNDCFCSSYGYFCQV